MPIKTDFPYPNEDYLHLFKDFYAGINGTESFDTVKEWQSDKWSAIVNCSRGTVLEKAGFSLVNIVGGKINENLASISIFETLAYPANPKIPGFIIMTNMNEMKIRGKIVVLYIDLIIQDGNLHDEEKKLFSTALKNICNKHGCNFEEYNAFLADRGILGGNAGECGLLNYFEEKDISLPLVKDLIKGVLPAYREILESTKNKQPRKDDYEKSNHSRARLIEWIIIEDIGVMIGRENGIPLKVIEAYAFPPVIRY